MVPPSCVSARLFALLFRLLFPITPLQTNTGSSARISRKRAVKSIYSCPNAECGGCQ